jgi:AcrR family transcriptional regulator
MGVLAPSIIRALWRMDMKSSQDRVGGRPRKLSINGKVALAQRLFADKKHAIDDICSTLGISRSTFYRYVRETAPPALDS